MYVCVCVDKNYDNLLLPLMNRQKKIKKINIEFNAMNEIVG